MSFKDLKVWQYGKSLAVEIYRLTGSEEFRFDYGLKDQTRRAAVSIPSNIAEGDERDTDKEAVRFFYIAKGSTAELTTQLIIAKEIGYIDNEAFSRIEESCTHIASMLGSLIKARRIRL
jgi:four helix bundle protein